VKNFWPDLSRGEHITGWFRQSKNSSSSSSKSSENCQ